VRTGPACSMGNADSAPEEEESPGAPVFINIYHASSQGPVQALNKVLRRMGTGIFHCGVEVYRQEWSFSRQGVFAVPPRGYDERPYLETVFMGFTDMSQFEVAQLILDFDKHWPGEQYHLVLNNCCHFSDALCRGLGVGRLPAWTTSLASTGEVLSSVGSTKQVGTWCEWEELPSGCSKWCGSGILAPLDVDRFAARPRSTHRRSRKIAGGSPGPTPRATQRRPESDADGDFLDEELLASPQVVRLRSSKTQPSRRQPQLSTDDWRPREDEQGEAIMRSMPANSSAPGAKRLPPEMFAKPENGPDECGPNLDCGCALSKRR